LFGGLMRRAPALESHATPLHRKGEAAARHSMRACLVLLEAAKRKEKKALPKPRTTRNIVDVCPLTVVKNLYIIHGSLGRPSLIGCLAFQVQGMVKDLNPDRWSAASTSKIIQQECL